MAVVEFSLQELEKLVGKTLTKNDIENIIPMIGCPLEKQEGNKLFYEIFPNRPDLLSVEGFARAMRYFLGLSKKKKDYRTKTSKIKITVDKGVKSIRPYVVCAAVKNVEITEDVLISLIQLQEKIHDTFGRKRKKIAIGIHDLDKVKPDFVYKAVSPEEISFVPLDMKKKMNLREIIKNHPKGKDYAHLVENYRKWPIILDKNNNVLSFPPIINGELTRVTEKTKNLFIDITGTHEIAINQALNILVTSFAERGFKIETVEVIDKKKITTPNLEYPKIKVNLDYINKLLDLDLKKDDFSSIIQKMDLYVDKSSGNFCDVLIPPYRIDIMHELDIAEDVAIGMGYHKFQPRLPKVPTISERLERNEERILLRDIMIGSGFQEVATMLLTNDHNEFVKMNIEETDVCRILNSVTKECNICRKNILPSILRVLTQNKHVEYPQNIFEVGECVILDNKAETGTKNVRKLCTAVSDVQISYEDISSNLDALFRNLGIKYSLKKTEHPSFISGRVAEIIVSGKSIGIIGEIRPIVLNNWNLEKPVVAFEIDVEKMK